MQWIDDGCGYRARISLEQEENTYEVDLQDSNVVSLIISAFLLLARTSPARRTIEGLVSPHAMRQLCSPVFRLIWAVSGTWLLDEWC